MSEARLEKITQLGAKKKTKKLLGYVGSKDAQERAAAAVAMGQIDEDDTFNALVSMLRDPDTNVRIAAINGLKAMNRKPAAEHIRHTMAASDDAALKKAGTEALASLHDLNG